MLTELPSCKQHVAAFHDSEATSTPDGSRSVQGAPDLFIHRNASHASASRWNSRRCTSAPLADQSDHAPLEGQAGRADSIRTVAGELDVEGEAWRKGPRILGVMG